MKPQTSPLLTLIALCLGMILVLLVFGGGIGFFAYQFGQQQMAMEVTREALSQPTATRNLYTPTQVPTQTARVQTVVVIQTASLPRIATPTPNSTSLAQGTPSIEEADTPPGTVLKPDETWKQNGMAMTVGSVQFNLGSGDNIFNVYVQLSNDTSNDVLINFRGTDISIISDNQAKTYASYFLSCNRIGIRPTPNPTLTLATETPPRLADIWECGGNNYSNLADLDVNGIAERQSYAISVLVTANGGLPSDANTFRLAVKRAGRIQDAVWEIPVPR